MKRAKREGTAADRLLSLGGNAILAATLADSAPPTAYPPQLRWIRRMGPISKKRFYEDFSSVYADDAMPVESRLVRLQALLFRWQAITDI